MSLALVEKLKQLQLQMESRDSDYDVYPKQKSKRTVSPTKKKSNINMNRPTRQNSPLSRAKRSVSARNTTANKENKPRNDRNSSPKRSIYLTKEQNSPKKIVKKRPIYNESKIQESIDYSSKFSMFVKSKNLEKVITKIFFEKWRKLYVSTLQKPKRVSRIPTRNPSVKRNYQLGTKYSRNDRDTEQKIQDAAKRFQGLNQYKDNRSTSSSRAGNTASQKRSASAKATKISPRRDQETETKPLIDMVDSDDDDELIQFTTNLLRKARAKQKMQQDPWKGLDDDSDSDNEQKEEEEEEIEKIIPPKTNYSAKEQEKKSVKRLLDEVIKHVEEDSDKIKYNPTKQKQTTQKKEIGIKMSKPEQKYIPSVEMKKAMNAPVSQGKRKDDVDSDDEIAALVNDVREITKRISPKHNRRQSPTLVGSPANQNSPNMGKYNAPLLLQKQSGKKLSAYSGNQTEMSINSNYSKNVNGNKKNYSPKPPLFSDSDEDLLVSHKAKKVTAEVPSDDFENDTIDLSLKEVLEKARRNQGQRNPINKQADAFYDDSDGSEVAKYMAQKKRKNETEVTLQLSPVKHSYGAEDDSSEDIERLIAQTKKQVKPAADSDEDFTSFLQEEQRQLKQLQMEESDDDILHFSAEKRLQMKGSPGLAPTYADSDEDFSNYKFQPKPTKQSNAPLVTNTNQTTMTTFKDDDDDEQDFLNFMRGKPNPPPKPKEKILFSPPKEENNDAYPLNQLHEQLAGIVDSDDEFEETIRPQPVVPKQNKNISPKVQSTSPSKVSNLSNTDMDSDEEFMNFLRNNRQRAQATSKYVSPPKDTTTIQPPSNSTITQVSPIKQDPLYIDSSSSDMKQSYSPKNRQNQESNELSDFNEKDEEFVASITGSRSNSPQSKPLITNQNNSDPLKPKSSKQTQQLQVLDEDSSSEDLNNLIKETKNKINSINKSKSPTKVSYDISSSSSSSNESPKPTPISSPKINETNPPIQNNIQQTQITATSPNKVYSDSLSDSSDSKEKENKDANMFSSDEEISQLIQSVSKVTQSARNQLRQNNNTVAVLSSDDEDKKDDEIINKKPQTMNTSLLNQNTIETSTATVSTDIKPKTTIQPTNLLNLKLEDEEKSEETLKEESRTETDASDVKRSPPTKQTKPIITNPNLKALLEDNDDSDDDIENFIKHNSKWARKSSSSDDENTIPDSTNTEKDLSSVEFTKCQPIRSPKVNIPPSSDVLTTEKSDDDGEEGDGFTIYPSKNIKKSPNKRELKLSDEDESDDVKQNLSTSANIVSSSTETEIEKSKTQPVTNRERKIISASDSSDDSLFKNISLEDMSDNDSDDGTASFLNFSKDSSDSQQKETIYKKSQKKSVQMTKTDLKDDLNTSSLINTESSAKGKDDLNTSSLIKTHSSSDDEDEEESKLETNKEEDNITSSAEIKTEEKPEIKESSDKVQNEENIKKETIKPETQENKDQEITQENIDNKQTIDIKQNEEEEDIAESTSAKQTHSQLLARINKFIEEEEEEEENYQIITNKEKSIPNNDTKQEQNDLNLKQDSSHENIFESKQEDYSNHGFDDVAIPNTFGQEEEEEEDKFIFQPKYIPNKVINQQLQPEEEEEEEEKHEEVQKSNEEKSNNISIGKIEHEEEEKTENIEIHSESLPQPNNYNQTIQIEEEEEEEKYEATSDEKFPTPLHNSIMKFIEEEDEEEEEPANETENQNDHIATPINSNRVSQSILHDEAEEPYKQETTRVNSESSKAIQIPESLRLAKNLLEEEDEEEEKEEVIPDRTQNKQIPASPIQSPDTETARKMMMSPPASPMKNVSFNLPKDSKLNDSINNNEENQNNSSVGNKSSFYKDLNLSENVSKLLEEMDQGEEEDDESAENFINRVYATTLKGAKKPDADSGASEFDNIDEEELMKSFDSPQKSKNLSKRDAKNSTQLEVYKMQIKALNNMEESEEETDDNEDPEETERKYRDFINLEISDSNEEN